MLDARAIFFVLLFVMRISLITFSLLVIVLGILLLIERRGLDFNAAMRAVRRHLSPKIKPPVPLIKQRYPVDYDRIHFKK